MNPKIRFSKLVGAGNDFVLVDNREKLFGSSRALARFAVAICNRRRGAGADGLLALERSRLADVRMRFFNADGSEGEMCGNGARCFAYFVSRQRRRKSLALDIETKAGIVHAVVKDRRIKIRLTPPRDVIPDIPLRLRNRTIRAHFIDTGVPHAVIFVDGLDRLDVDGLGRQIRHHRRFAPAGTNVNFVQTIGAGDLRIRTYERGVEAETLACGTGSTAAALIMSLKSGGGQRMVRVHTRGGEILKVYFRRKDAAFEEVWLEGPARIVYTGSYSASFL